MEELVMPTKIITVLVILVLAGFGMASWSGGQAGASAAASAATPGVITVTGDAEVLVVPDEVVLTLGIETWDKNLNRAKQQNDSRAGTVIDTIQSFGVAARHIQTDHISIQPVYDDYNQLTLDGYFVRKTIVITLKDISKFEDLLTATIEAGANNVHGIDFRTTELRRHRDKARELAVQAAQEKATAMAGTLGQQAGKAQTVQENNNHWWSSYNSWWGYRSGMMTQNVIQEVGGPAYTDGTTIAPGQITVRAQVTVSFELE
jgi:uncharacterized protein YggE